MERSSIRADTPYARSWVTFSRVRESNAPPRRAHPLPGEGEREDHSLSLRIVKEMRFFPSSTSRTHTVTTSPTLSTSEGCLM